MQQWEYREEVVPMGKQLVACQQLGQEGWELTSAVPTMAQQRIAAPGQHGPMACLLLLFKRPIQTVNRFTNTVSGHESEFIFAR